MFEDAFCAFLAEIDHTQNKRLYDRITHSQNFGEALVQWYLMNEEEECDGRFLQ